MQKHKHARIFAASGSLLILMGAAALIAARAYRSSDVGGSAVIALYLVGFVAMFAGVKLVQRGRKLVSLSADQATTSDKRPPVLYLRPFGFDEVLSRTPERTPH